MNNQAEIMDERMIGPKLLCKHCCKKKVLSPCYSCQYKINMVLKKVEKEFKYFPNQEMIQSFRSLMVQPYIIKKEWHYGPEVHDCWVVGKDSENQTHFIYCETGFGPDFPWSDQPFDEKHLGMDGQWCAYLFETYASHDNWDGEFVLTGPGERDIECSECGKLALCDCEDRF